MAAERARTFSQLFPDCRFDRPVAEIEPAQLSSEDALLALAHAGIVQAGLHHALPFLRSGRLKLLLVDRHDVDGRIGLQAPERGRPRLDGKVERPL